MKRFWKKHCLEVPFYTLLVVCTMWAFSFAAADDLAEARHNSVELPAAEEMDMKEPPAPAPKRTSLGTFTVTAYCPCEKCCGVWSNVENPTTASGKPAEQGVTVGADWNTLAAGTDIIIEGVGRRTVQDKPAGWIIEKYDGRILDLYFNSHEEALQFGKRTLEVFVEE